LPKHPKFIDIPGVGGAMGAGKGGSVEGTPIGGPSVGKGVMGAGDSRVTPPVGANVLFVPASTKTDD